MNDDSRRMILPSFPPEYRASGMLVHVPSLPSPYGIGDVRPAAGGGKSARGRIASSACNSSTNGLIHRSRLLYSAGRARSPRTDGSVRYYTRINTPATPEQKARLERLLPEAIQAPNLAGEPIVTRLTRAPGNGAPVERRHPATHAIVSDA